MLDRPVSERGVSRRLPPMICHGYISRSVACQFPPDGVYVKLTWCGRDRPIRNGMALITCAAREKITFAVTSLVIELPFAGSLIRPDGVRGEYTPYHVRRYVV